MTTNTCLSPLSNVVDLFSQYYANLPVIMYDVGARYGIHYLYTELLKLAKFQVIGFEPDQQEVDKLNNSSMSSRFKTFPVALAASKGQRTVYITKHPGCSSLYPPNLELAADYALTDFLEVIQEVPVETISIDEFTQEFDVAKPDFIKLDIQGAEYEVLKGGQQNLTDNILGIFLETHLQEIYLGSASFFEIHALLTNLGFKLIYCEYNSNYGGEIVECDVAYVKGQKYLTKEEEIIKAFLFSIIHNNLDFAANIVRSSSLEHSKKLAMLAAIAQPLDRPTIQVNSADIYVNSKTELRKIKEDWWQ